jgi:hypothetical protein
MTKSHGARIPSVRFLKLTEYNRGRSKDLERTLGEGESVPGEIRLERWPCSSAGYQSTPVFAGNYFCYLNS